MWGMGTSQPHSCPTPAPSWGPSSFLLGPTIPGQACPALPPSLFLRHARQLELGSIKAPSQPWRSCWSLGEAAKAGAEAWALCPYRVAACTLPDTLPTPMKRVTLSWAEAAQAPAGAEDSKQPCSGAEAEEPPSFRDAVGSIRAGVLKPGLAKALSSSLVTAGVPTWLSPSIPAPPRC